MFNGQHLRASYRYMMVLVCKIYVNVRLYVWGYVKLYFTYRYLHVKITFSELVYKMFCFSHRRWVIMCEILSSLWKSCCLRIRLTVCPSDMSEADRSTPGRHTHTVQSIQKAKNTSFESAGKLQSNRYLQQICSLSCTVTEGYRLLHLVLHCFACEMDSLLGNQTGEWLVKILVLVRSEALPQVILALQHPVSTTSSA